MINRTRELLVPFVFVAMAVGLFVLSGCRDKVEGPVGKAAPQEKRVFRMDDPAYRTAMMAEVSNRKELLRTRTRLEGELERALAIGDVIEATSLSNRIVEINEAIGDIRRHMLKTIRSYMTNGTQRAVK